MVSYPPLCRVDDSTLEAEQKALLEHLKLRPEIPVPLPVAESPAWKKWRAARAAWVDRLEALELRVDILRQGGMSREAARSWRSERMCAPTSRGGWND